jgi:hypothetical protein
MSERSWGYPRELCEQVARNGRTLMATPPYRGFFTEVTT